MNARIANEKNADATATAAKIAKAVLEDDFTKAAGLWEEMAGQCLRRHNMSARFACIDNAVACLKVAQSSTPRDDRIAHGDLMSSIHRLGKLKGAGHVFNGARRY